MSALLILLALASGQTGMFHLPAISDSCDVIVVMIEDGAVPAQPWEGISDYHREELWTFGCAGLMVERLGWSGYVIITPPGAGTEILETAEILAIPSSVIDGGEASVWMDFEPVSETGPVILLYSSGGSDDPPAQLPLRSSTWLSGPSDTLIIQPTPVRSTFFWTGLPDSVSLANSAWRGTGMELVPAGGGSVRVAFSAALGNIPSGLHAVSGEPHPLDGDFMSGWGAAFAAVDSLIATLHPVTADSGHLLWLRGNAHQGAFPLMVSPSPQPPASVRFEMSIPQGWTGVPVPGHTDPSLLPGVILVEFPGMLSDPGLGEIMASVLERMIMRSVIPSLGIDTYFDVVHDGDGGMKLWLLGADGESLPEGMGEDVRSMVREASLFPPGAGFLANATVRTILTTGTMMDTPSPNLVAGELLRLTGGN